MMLRIMFKIMMMTAPQPPSNRIQPPLTSTQAMLRAVDARGWSCESYSQRVALLELLEARKAMGF